jgi:hypothetical protein
VGTVEIYRTLREPKLLVGKEIDINTSAELGEKVPIISSQTAKDDLRGTRLVYYLPVTVQGSIGVIGESCYVTAVDDVSRLRGSISGTNLLLKWVWPANTKRCRVLMRTDRFARGAEDPQAQKEEVLLSVYESKGGYYTSIPHGATEVFVSVHSGVAVGEKLIYAAGSSASARQRIGVASQQQDGAPRVTTLRYRIVAPAAWLKWLAVVGLKKDRPHRVILSDAAHNITLPALLVVSKHRLVPRNAADGDVLATFAAGTEVKPGETITLEFSAGALAPNTLARLFPADAADADWLKLEPLTPRMDIGS